MYIDELPSSPVPCSLCSHGRSSIFSTSACRLGSSNLESSCGRAALLPLRREARPSACQSYTKYLEYMEFIDFDVNIASS